MRRFRILCLIMTCPLLNIWAGGSDDGRKNQVERYNQALQLYGEGSFEKSSQLLDDLHFPEQKKQIDKMLLQSASRYRMGENLAEREGDLSGALIHIDNSIGFLQRVLELDGDNPAASNNIEILLNYRQKLLDRQEQQNRSGQSEQSPQDQADELRRAQEQMAEDQNKQSDQHKESQKELREKTEQLRDETEQGSPQREDLEEAVQSQKEAEEAIEKGERKMAEEKQREAAQYLREAVEKMAGPSGESQTVPDDDSGTKDREEILQSILDREESRNEKSDATGRGITVEKNW